MPTHLHRRHTYAERYRLRISRKRLLWRGVRSRQALSAVSVQSAAIENASLLVFATVRNEMLRLPHFLKYYRARGVQHFLIVSNDSTDETDAYLAQQPDVSLWTTQASYKDARFGMDWLTWLQRKYAHGKWALTVDADELLAYPGDDRFDLVDLTQQLDDARLPAMSAMLLDLYPKGSPDGHHYDADDDPLDLLTWMDPGPYQRDRRGRHKATSVTGGVRLRMFFEQAPQFAPVLSKVPLVKWRRSYAYFSSTHVILPVDLNNSLDPETWPGPSGILLHTKFLPGIGARAEIDHSRGQQYVKAAQHNDYYRDLAGAPDLWTKSSVKYEGTQQLLDMKLMRNGCLGK